MIFYLSDVALKVPCAGGYKQAIGIMKPEEAYSLRALIDLGAYPENMLWLIVEKYRDDQRIVSLICAGAAKSIQEHGLCPRSIVSLSQCAHAYKAISEALMRGKGLSKETALRVAVQATIDVILEEESRGELAHG